MMFTLKDARKLCSSVAQAGGTCSTSPLIDARINEAVRRLAREADVPELTMVMHVLAQGNTLTLPMEVKSARLANINLSPVRIRHVGYEFSTSGPGEEAECECGSLSLIAEPGLFPTFFELPKGRSLKIAAFLPAREAGATDIRVFGRKCNGEVLREPDRDGVPLRVSTWKDGIEGEVQLSEVRFTDEIDQIEQVSLPARQSYLTLLAYDAVTHETWFLAKYHPTIQRPGFRRYRIRGATCCESHCVSLLVKLHPAEVLYPDDILPVQNIDAIKQMIMGIKEENSRNAQQAMYHFAQAKAMISKEIADHQGSDEVRVQGTDDYSYGGGSLSL